MKKGTILFDDILTTIGEDAFKDCENLTSITLPKKVNGILANAFQNCINLNEINYKGTSSDFKKIKFEANWNDNIPVEYVYCNDDKVRIKYNYLTFTALEDNCSIGFYNNPDSSVNPTIEYSFDKNTWSTLTDNVTVENGSKMYCRGLNPNGISGGYGESGYNYFTGEGKFNVSGDIMSIIDYETMPETMVGTFYNLFGGDGAAPRDNFIDIVDASGLILSAKTLTDDCYANMFDSCTSMVYSPKIEAEILAPYCCYKMFYNCNSLTVAPELPVTELATECYAYMFYECISLTTAPELPATVLAESCYYYMFLNCYSLTTAPELPATELAKSCYNSMFSRCYSLTTAPKILPATELAEKCYSYMFNKCESLTTAPELPATTLANSCYSYMFRDCISLTTAPELPATTLAKSCYNSMFWNCNSLITAPELPATILTEDCYQYMFEYCTSLNYIKCLATDISATGCTNGWVDEVSNTGTFVKHPDMSDWSEGIRGIPSGWNVVDAEIPYVTFKAEEANSTIRLNQLSTNQTLEYSRDGSKWYNMKTSTTITLANVGDEVYIRGILSGNNSDLNYTQFKMTGKIAASGNCNAIWNYEDLNAPLKEYCGYNMFSSCKSLTAAPKLPATTLANSCYESMFYFCTPLTVAPKLPATTLANSCYDGMFSNCRSLTAAPELPATELAEDCYSSMFSGCSNLTTAPELPATTLANNCYSRMFEWCSSLTTAPELPATVLAESCYYYMFLNCYSLTTAPELPATELVKSCYNQMFYRCTSLTIAPELLATELADSCYYYMFYNCTNLNYIKCLATNIPANICTSNWVNGVSSTGTFIKHPDMNNWNTSVNGIPSGWTVVDAEI